MFDERKEKYHKEDQAKDFTNPENKPINNIISLKS